MLLGGLKVKSVDEVCKLMSEIDKCSMPEQAIVLSLLNTGVRRAELAGLTWSDFDFKEYTVHVNKSLLVFRDFGYQHTATKESNDRYIDAAPSTWHLCSNAKSAGSRYAIS